MIDYERSKNTKNINHHRNPPSSSSSDLLPDGNGAAVTQKRKRRPAGTPDPEAEVVSLSPRTLLESDRYVCEICNQGFQRDQNLQMHRRRHKVPWKLLKRETTEEVKKRVYRERERLPLVMLLINQIQSQICITSDGKLDKPEHGGEELKPSIYLHNFTDGMALGSASLIYGSVGGWSRIEPCDFGILVRSGFTVTKALFFNFLSALVALAGTFTGKFWSGEMNRDSHH
ncbi:hypothetical protein DY000_02063288 [Brassica cretica]|uniref:C2H2-type domain-containing protein n=1 Tax=Brassica cretica TaxID=69181 RepID=A0ABQ7AQW0_BRACR|nr:hypothetical protein DY000_02063288 [Brassica cretica]